MRGKGWAVRLLAACALLVSLATASCTDRGRLGEPFRLNGTEGGAGTFTWAYYTAIVASGDAVLAAWLNQNGALLRNAVTRRSVDGGKNWSEESVLNDGEYANTVSVTPRLTILPGERRVLAVWQSRRNEAGQKFVLARRSEDFGGTWQPPARLNERPQAFLPAVATNDDGVVVVAYDDERNINRDIYANRSLDEGRTWLAKDVRIDTLPRSESGAPAAAIGSDGYAYVVWEEHPRTMKERQMISPHLLAASSADRGVTWSEPHRVLPGEHETTPLWPALVESRGRLTLVWSEGLTGQASKGWLWLASSTDRGKTWSAPVAVYEGEVQPLYQIVARGEHLYLTWHGGEGKQRGGIYFNASDDGGGTWRQPWTEPLRLDRAGESAIAYHPRIAIHRDAEVAVTWQESNQRVLVSVSRDGGRTWPEPTIIAETANKETETLRYPQVAVTGDAAYVLWESWKERSPKKSIADIKKTSPRDVFVRRMTLS